MHGPVVRIHRWKNDLKRYVEVKIIPLISEGFQVAQMTGIALNHPECRSLNITGVRLDRYGVVIYVCDVGEGESV